MAQPAANGTHGESETTTRPGGILDHESAPYVIKNEIGKGSFATVYRGFHRDSRAAVAIKTVSRSILTPKLIDNLESEINILKQLKHPHITELIEIVKSERFIFLIMEDCTGGDLSGYIKRRGRVESLRYIPEPGAAPIYYPHPRTGGLDIVAVRSFLRQMGRALKFLRQRNLIHRDIKPQNLLLKPATPADHEKGHPLGIPILKIADFGFARHLPNTMLAETLCGSPLYMAPEILRYEKYGSQADLWSVGAVLYEISVGKPPFRAQNHIELLKRIEQARSTVKFPDEEEGSTLTPVPPDIKKLIRALLKRHPVERVTFEEFFVSKAMANSKFHAPKSIEDGNYVGSPSSYSPKSIGTMTPLTNGNSKLPPPVMIPHIPENHRIIPPEVLDPQALVPPSNFNFRKAPNGTSHTGSQVGSSVPASSSNGAPVHHPSSSPAARPSPLRRPVSLTPELPTPAEADEESFLKSDYVVIGDTRHVEFNQRVDELTAARQRTIRRASATPSEKISSTSSPSSSPAQQPQQQQPALVDNGKGLTSSPRKPMLIGLPSNDKFTFPPAPIEGVNAEGQARTRPPPPRTGSSALSRALNLASKKIWGTGTSASSSHASTNPHSPTLVSSPSAAGYPPTPSSLGSATTAVGSTPNTVTPVPLSESPGKLFSGSPKTNGHGHNHGHPMNQILSQKPDVNGEDKLLAGLEILAQKVEVIVKWADELFELVKAIPEKPLPDPEKFVLREGESPRHGTRRRNAQVDAELAAVNCISLYMLVMTFAQNGVDRLRDFMDTVELDDEPSIVSVGFDEAVDWFGACYEKCSQGAQTVRTWLPEGGMNEPTSYMDQVLFDRALTLSRNAARKEILDQDSWQCEGMYQDALWLLYTVRDDLERQANAFIEEDMSNVDIWITRTKLRHHRCKERATMPEGARRKDAQADQNLDDVNRFPPPWDLQPLPSPSPSSPTRRR